jgi:hypothetical protein
MGDAATFNRPHCGALYTVTAHQRLAVESGCGWLSFRTESGAAVAPR